MKGLYHTIPCCPPIKAIQRRICPGDRAPGRDSACFDENYGQEGAAIVLIEGFYAVEQDDLLGAGSLGGAKEASASLLSSYASSKCYPTFIPGGFRIRAGEFFDLLVVEPNPVFSATGELMRLQEQMRQAFAPKERIITPYIPVCHLKKGRGYKYIGWSLEPDGWEVYPVYDLHLVPYEAQIGTLHFDLKASTVKHTDQKEVWEDKDV